MSKRLNPRFVAVKALCKVDADGSYSNITLNEIFREYELQTEDRSLCTAIFYGVLERKITIDFILAQFVKNGFSKLRPFTLNLLRSAVYQLKFMDKIPDSAAVNESVKIIKASKESYNSGFINGVLRNIARSEVLIPSGSSVFDLSVRYSCPESIVKELINDIGIVSAENFLADSLLPPPTYIQVNTKKTSTDSIKELLKQKGIEVLSTDTANCLKISGYSSLERMSEFKNGLFFVQDISCRKAIGLLNIQDNDRILDLCSAPGGKAFSAYLSAENVCITAADLYPTRVDLIRKSSKRLGFLNIEPIVSDATVYSPDIGIFDKVICDVPCSGLGVLRRKPEIKYKQIEDFDDLTSIQKSILNNADKYLKKGGSLLYSTCTLRCAENEDIVRDFLNTHSDYDLITMKTFMPETDNSDGFFAAVLIKK